MKFVILLLSLTGFYGLPLAQYRISPTPLGQFVRILRQNQEGPNPDGSYQWSFEAENGISAEDQGIIKNLGNAQAEAMEAIGGFRFTSPEGQVVEIRYVSNENGYQPVGNALPTPPPIPDAILRSLQYNAAHPEEDESQDGGIRRFGRK